MTKITLCFSQVSVILSFSPEAYMYKDWHSQKALFSSFMNYYHNYNVAWERYLKPIIEANLKVYYRRKCTQNGNQCNLAHFFFVFVHSKMAHNLETRSCQRRCDIVVTLSIRRCSDDMCMLSFLRL